MKRFGFFVVIVAAALATMAGVALADNVNCFPNRTCVGTNGSDLLEGTSSYDDMDCRQGSDVMYGHERYDFMSGDSYDARDTSTDGNDRVGGGQNGDELVGYGCSDKLLGRSGGDFIYAEESSENEGEDLVGGEGGNDWILARDGVKDTIACGTGRFDTVYFDRGIDTVLSNCERKRGGIYSTGSTSGASEEVSAKELEGLRDR